MQRLIREEGIVRRDELQAWNVAPDGDILYALFYLEVTDSARYLEALESVDMIREYDVTHLAEDAMYVYVREDAREVDQRFFAAFSALNLVVVPPVIYDETAGMRMTIVGAGESLQTLLEGVPAGIETTVHEVGEYDHRAGTIAGALTDRQREAVTVALEVGYYDVPKTGSLADVAAELGCAQSTASTHLKKAQSVVMERLVDRRFRGR